MNYRPPFITIALGLLLILASHFGLTKTLTASVTKFISPVLAAETSSTHKAINFLTVIVTIRNLARENAVLTAKNYELTAEIANLKEVAHENEVLKNELHFTEQNQDTYIPAQLIGRTPTGLIKDLLVNRGAVDGLTPNLPVIAQGYLIGVVSEVSPHQAVVRQLTNPKTVIPVITQESRSTGLLRGGISGLTITDLLIDSAVAANETVLTTSLEPSLPSSIPIGKIVTVSARQGDITKKASLVSPIDTSHLEIVFIRKGNH